MALTGSQIEGRNVVSSVTILELDSLSTNCKTKKLVTKTDSEDWDLRGLHQAVQVVDSLLAMGWVSWTIGDKDSIEVVGDLVDWIVVWEDSDASTTADKASENILLDTAVDDSNVHVTISRANMERSLCADSLYQVDLLWIDESLVLIGIILFSDSDPS